jgi:hypothetical protein
MWQAPGIRISAQVDRAVFEAQATYKSMMKAILNGSMDHNMRDGCSNKTGLCVLALLEIMDKSRS